MSAVEQVALTVAKGSYQPDIVAGYESMSGSTLSRTAASHGGKYHRSRKSLLAALAAAGLKTEIATVNGRGKNVLFVCTAEELINAPLRNTAATTVRVAVELIAREDAEAAAKAARREKRLAKADAAALATLA